MKIVFKNGSSIETIDTTNSKRPLFINNVAKEKQLKSIEKLLKKVSLEPEHIDEETQWEN